MTPKKELAYYLTIFKTKGHSTWRAHFSGSLDDFNAQAKQTTVTEKKHYRIDRLTSEIKPFDEKPTA
jgi:hypothetical protein